MQVDCSEGCIMSSCVKPLIQSDFNPVVLLHCFDRFEIKCKSCHGCNIYHLMNIFFLSWLFCVFQFMFRMEVHIPLAWRGWFGGLGHWCSWMGLLWFRLVHLPLLLYFLDLTYSMLFNNLPFLMPALTRKASTM